MIHSPLSSHVYRILSQSYSAIIIHVGMFACKFGDYVNPPLIDLDNNFSKPKNTTNNNPDRPIQQFIR